MYVWECPCYAVVHATCPRRCRCGLSLWQDSDGYTRGIDNYQVCLPHTGQSHSYNSCLCLSLSWVYRCCPALWPRVMTVSVSTLLTGRYGCNCLYLSWLRNKSLVKRSFRKVVLADSCCGFNLAMPSSSVSYHECVPNRACQEGRNFAPVHAIWPFVFLSVLSLWQNSAVLEWRVSLWDCSPGSVDRCICPGCPRPMATCVMTVSVSTLLTGRYGRNCLYLNWLSNKSLAKRSFWKVVLADSCSGFNLATPSSSVSYHECTPNRACQEGRKSWLSLFGFRKFCACPLIMATQVSLLCISVAEPRSEMPAR